VRESASVSLPSKEGGFRLGFDAQRRAGADVKLPFAMTGPKTNAGKAVFQMQTSSPTSCGSSRNCGRRRLRQQREAFGVTRIITSNGRRAT